MVEFREDFKPQAPPAWPTGHKYGQPCKCKLIPGEKKVKYVQPARATSFKPCKVYRPSEVKSPTDTTYKLSFEGFEPGMLRNCRGKQLIPRENLLPAGDFSDLTTHKLSYGALPGITRQPLIYPRDHRLSGEGPMQEITTQKHDYTPKCIDSVVRVVHPDNLTLSKAPFADASVANMSYMAPDGKFERPSSFKPESRYLPPMSPLDDGTVHKMSFMPWEPQPKQDLPWAKPQQYKTPKESFDGSTIYNGSFLAPGRLVEDPEGHCLGCYCVYPAECFAATGEKPAADTCPVGYNPNKDPPRPPPLTVDSQMKKGS